MIDFRFYLISDRNLCRGRPLTSVLKQACQAGVRAIQIREKDLTSDDLLNLTKTIKIEPAAYKPLIMINSSINVTLDSGVGGIHLPENIKIQMVRKDLPKGVLIARSTHSRAGAEAAEAEGADFITYGPIYYTPSKAQYGPPKGLRELSKIAKSVKIPIFALGGITPDRTRECLDAGAYGVAAISAVLEQPDISVAVTNFVNALHKNIS